MAEGSFCVYVCCINRHIGQWLMAKIMQRVISTNGRNVMLSLAIIFIPEYAMEQLVGALRCKPWVAGSIPIGLLVFFISLIVPATL